MGADCAIGTRQRRRVSLEIEILAERAFRARQARLRSRLAHEILRGVASELFELCAMQRDRLAREGLLESSE